MAAEPMIAVLNAAPAVLGNRSDRLYAAMSDYWALTKPEVNFLILITTFAGFYLASAAGPGGFRILPVINTLLGTLLVAGGTGTLNQFLERSFDAQMRRTARRPLASGRLKASRVLRFGIILSLTGTVYLALAVNVLASLLALVTLLSYLFLYTPLKRKTPLCTLVGAFPGAAPPLIGLGDAPLPSTGARLPVEQLQVKNGVVSVKGDESKSISYGALAGGNAFNEALRVSGGGFALNVEGKGKLKDPASYTVVGQSVPRVDLPPKIIGRATYSTDVPYRECCMGG